MKKHFVDMSTSQRVMFLLGVLAILVSVALLPFAFFDQPGLVLGWIGGNLVSMFAYLSIVYGSKTLLSKEQNPFGLGLTVLFAILRFALYAVGLVIAGLCTFYWKNNWLSFWTVFAGYMPMPLIVSINHFIEASIEKKKAAKKEEGENRE